LAVLARIVREPAGGEGVAAVMTGLVLVVCVPVEAIADPLPLFRSSGRWFAARFAGQTAGGVLLLSRVPAGGVRQAREARPGA
jgi:hypothetical protein